MMVDNFSDDKNKNLKIYNKIIDKHIPSALFVFLVKLEHLKAQKYYIILGVKMEN